MLDFLFLALALIAGLGVLVLAAKAVGYTSPRPSPSPANPGFARQFLARWLAGGYDYLNRGTRTPKKAPKGRIRGFAPRPVPFRRLTERQAAFLAMKGARKEERRDKKAAAMAATPIQATQASTTQTSVAQIAPTTVNTENLAQARNTLNKGLDRAALAARRARRAAKRAKAKAKAQQSMQAQQINQPQQIKQIKQTQKVEKTRSIRDVSQPQKAKAVPQLYLEERQLLEAGGYVFRRTLGAAYAVLKAYPSKKVIVEDMVVLHDHLVRDNAPSLRALCKRGFRLLTCNGYAWAQEGYRVAVARKGALYLTKEGRVGVNKTEGAIALGTAQTNAQSLVESAQTEAQVVDNTSFSHHTDEALIEEAKEALLEESGFNGDGWKSSSWSPVYEMVQSATNFVFNRVAVEDFNARKKVIKGVTRLFRCVKTHPGNILIAAPGLSFSLVPQTSFGGTLLYVDVASHEVEGFPLYHPDHNFLGGKELEVLVGGVFSIGADGGLTPLPSPKNFGAYNKVRTYGFPGIEAVYEIAPESSIIEFVPHKEFAVVEGMTGHAIIDIDVAESEGHLTDDCITAETFEQAEQMAQDAVKRLAAIEARWSEHAIVRTGGGIRIYGPVMQVADLTEGEWTVIEDVCDPLYIEKLKRTEVWSFRCTPKVINGDFRKEEMDILKTTPTKEPFVTKMQAFFKGLFEAGLTAFRNAVKCEQQGSLAVELVPFADKVFDGSNMGMPFPSGPGYELEVLQVPNFSTFSSSQIKDLYQKAKNNKLFFWYSVGLAAVDSLVYGSLLAERQVVVMDKPDNAAINTELNKIDVECGGIETMLFQFLVEEVEASEEYATHFNKVMELLPQLLVVVEEETPSTEKESEWMEVCSNYDKLYSTSQYVQKYFVHEEDKDEVLNRLIAGEAFITCNPGQWSGLGYKAPLLISNVLAHMGLGIEAIGRIGWGKKNHHSIFIEILGDQGGWVEVLYHYKTDTWRMRACTAPKASKTVFFGQALKWCRSMPASPSFSAPGDIFMSPELAYYMQEMGQNRSPYEVVAGRVLVDDGYGLQTKQFAVFHGTREYGKLDGQAWFELAIENVDLVFCCHWGITLPTELAHKAVPMWYSRVTGLNKGDVMRIRAMGLPHTLQAHHEEVEQGLFRLAWGQWWQKRVVFGTDHYNFQGRLYSREDDGTIEELVRGVEAAKASPEYQGMELLGEFFAASSFCTHSWIEISPDMRHLGLPSALHLGAEDPEEIVGLLKKFLRDPNYQPIIPTWMSDSEEFTPAYRNAIAYLELVEDGLYVYENLVEFLGNKMRVPHLKKLCAGGDTAEKVHEMMPELPAVIEVPALLDKAAVGKATREINRLANELVDEEGGDLTAVDLEFAVEKNRVVIRLYTCQFVGRTLVKEGSTKLGWLYDLLYTGTPNHKLRNEFQEKLGALLKGLTSKDVTRWERVDDVLSTYLPENGTSYTQVHGASCQDFATTPINFGFVNQWDTGFGMFYSKHRSNPHIYNWLSFFNIVKAYVLRSKDQIVARTLLVQTKDGIAIGSMYGDASKMHLHNALVSHLEQQGNFLFDNATMPYVASMGSMPYNDVDIRFQKTEQPGATPFVRFTYKGANPMKRVLVAHKEEILAMSAEDRANFEFVLCCDREEVARVTGLKPYGDVQKYPRAFRNSNGVAFLADEKAEKFVVLCEGVDFEIPFVPENLVELGTKSYYDGYLLVDDSMPNVTTEQGVLGDFAVTPEFAALDLALGNRESTYKVLAGNCAVKTVDGWVVKKLVSFHGSAQVPSDPFFHKLVARAEVILCCHWANMLPIEQQHKAVPMIWSSITGQGVNVLSQTASHPHTMAAGWESKDGVSTMTWSLIWKNVRKVDYLGYDYFQDIAVLGNRKGLENLPVGVTTRGSDSPDSSKTDGLSLSSPETGRNVGGSMEKKPMGEELVRACQMACRRKADGTISMKFKNSAFTALWNELLGIVASGPAPSNNRPVVPGHGDCPAENVQGLPVYMAAYEGKDGWRVGMPAFKVEEGANGPANLYTRAGYAWNGLSNFGIYGGSPADEHARHPSTMRVQFPQNITTAEGVRLVFVDFSNPNTPDKLVELGVLAAPQEFDRKHLLQLIKADMLGVVAGDKEPGIDGTIWVATTGVPFAPKMPKGMSSAVYQFRGSCVFPEEVTLDLLAQAEEYCQLAAEVRAELDQFRAILPCTLIAATTPRLSEWVERYDRDEQKLTDYLEVLSEEGNYDVSRERWTQVVTYDLLIGKNVATHESYFKTSGHYGAYLKGAAATRNYLAHGVVLIDINAVKDISKKLVKEALKANQGAFEAPAGQKYVIGMMQDYSRGGIRVGAQPNTYIRSHYEGEFVMAEHIDRYISFLADQTLAQLQSGIGVGEIISNLRKALGFTNAGEFELEGLLVEAGDQMRGHTAAFWNHPSGRKQIENLFKTICNRYTFGFETKAMERIGTFVSVKGYLSDCNVLPPAFPNGKLASNSVLVEFEGSKFDTSLPLPVVLFKNDQFWAAMKRDVTLAGVLRYPVSNKDMFSGYLVVSPAALIRDAQLRELTGFGQWDVETLKWFFSGLSQGIYANSLTVKELLCGDTDGDTAGIVPVDADWTLQGRTITVSLNNGDAKFFWAITETRDLTKRRFAELEGFVHLQGKRRLNAACVDKVLGESGLATGSCALMQQIVSAVLTTHDKGSFVLANNRASITYGRGEDRRTVRVETAEEAASLWAWFVGRYLEAAYVLLPVSLELAIMSQKKDLIQAFHAVTSLFIDGQSELVYGENNERRATLYSPTLNSPRISPDVELFLARSFDEMRGEIGWAALFGTLLRRVMRLCGVQTRIEGQTRAVNFVSSTRTTTIVESIPANLLLANRSDEAWGILTGDNLDWTNHYWVEYVGVGYRAIRETVQGMTSNASTYGADVELRTNWNRGYDRGSFAALNVNSARLGIHVADKDEFFRQVARWIEIKATSRIFGMNLHGWTRLTETGESIDQDGSPEDLLAAWSARPVEERQKIAMVFWAWLHNYQQHRGLRASEWAREWRKDVGRQWWIKKTFDQMFLTEKEDGAKDSAWMKRQLERVGIEVSEAQAADVFYLAVIHGKLQFDDSAFGVYRLASELGLTLDELLSDEVLSGVESLALGLPTFVIFDHQNRMTVNQDSYAAFVGLWKRLVEKTQLASSYRASVKNELAELTKEWTEDTYASLYALANQEVGFAYGQTTRWTREMTPAQVVANMNKARQFREEVSTEYVRHVFSKADVPTTFGYFRRPNQFILEVVMEEMESKRIAFEESWFRYSFVAAEGVTEIPKKITVRPWFRDGVHAVELLNTDGSVLGWVPCDPTSRVLLYFKDEELEVVGFLKNRNPNKVQAGFITNLVKDGNDGFYLAEAPAVAADQKIMLDRFMTINADQVQGCTFGIIIVKAEMKSEALMIQRYVKAVEKAVEKALKGKKDVSAALSAKKADKRMVAVAGDAALDLQNALIGKVLGNDNWTSEKVDGKIQKTWTVQFGEATINSFNGVIEVDRPEVELAEEVEVTAAVITTDEAYLNSLVDEVPSFEEEEVDYPMFEEGEEGEEEFPADDVNPSDVSAQQTEEIVEVAVAQEQASDFPAADFEVQEELVSENDYNFNEDQDFNEEASEEVVELVEEVTEEQTAPANVRDILNLVAATTARMSKDTTPVRGSAPVVPVVQDAPAVSGDSAILAQIAALVGQLNPITQQVFNAGVNAAKAKLVEEKAKLEQRQAELRAQLAEVQKQLRDVETALNDDDDGDDDGGGNGGGTPAPADSGPATPPPAPAAPAVPVPAAPVQSTAPPAPQQAEAITEFRGNHNFLSNFSFVQIEFKGKKYKSVEHFYQAMKFRGYPDLQNQIRNTVSAGDVKRIANQNKDKVRSDWDEVKLDVMKWALQQKFSKPSLKTALLRTGDAVISHVNTWGDAFWGVCRGVGEDHLGKMLMEVRDELK